MATRELILINNALEDMRSHDLSEGFLSFRHDDGETAISWHVMPDDSPLQEKIIFKYNIDNYGVTVQGHLYIENIKNVNVDDIMRRINKIISMAGGMY